MRILLFAILLLGCAACGSRPSESRTSQSALVAAPCSAWTDLPRPIPHADSVRAVFIAFTGSFEQDRRDLDTLFARYRFGAVVVHNIKGYDSINDPAPVNRIRQAVYLLQHRPAHTDVYIGLGYQENFYAKTVTATDLETGIRQDRALADTLLMRADTFANRITGWYIAREIHNFLADDQPAQTALVHGFLRREGDTLPRGGLLPENPRILISPYFIPKVPPREDELLDPAGTGKLFADLVEGTKITDVLLQDGTGVRNSPDHQLACSWRNPAHYRPIAARYMDAVFRSLPKGKVFWANLEGFVQDSDRLHDVKRRFAQQLSVVPAGRPLIMYAAAQCDSVGVCAGAPGR